MCGLCLPSGFKCSLDFHERNQLTAENHRKDEDEGITQGLRQRISQSNSFPENVQTNSCLYI